MPALPFSIAATAADKAGLETAMENANSASSQPVPGDILDAALALLLPLPDPADGSMSMSISGLLSQIPPDPDKPGTGQRPYIRIEING